MKSAFRQSNRGFVYFLLLIFIIALSDIVFSFTIRQYAEAVWRMLTCFSAFLIPIYIFRNRLRLYVLLLLPVFLIVPMLICSVVFFHLKVSENLLLLMANTSKRESMAIVRQYLLPLSLTCAATAIVFIVLYRKTPRKIASRPALQISVCSLLLFLLLPFSQSDYITLKNSYVDKLKANIAETFPFSIMYSAKVVYNNFALMKSSAAERKKFFFHAQQIPYRPEKQVYVLVIGETSRRDHWGINGYYRNTSPLISKRENLISFSNVVAGACETEFAVPQIITGVDPDHFEDHYKQKGIASAFKEAGFATYWITDQIDYGNIKMHEEEADSVYRLQLSMEDSITMDNTDVQLISYLKKALADSGDRKFIVIHTLGSHWDYKQQYTAAFDVFKPSEKTIPAQPSDFSKKEILVNSYDNSILFTDFFLDSVIRVLSQEKLHTTLFFISDHGEDLFDNSDHRFLHGDFEATIFSAGVPLFIWYNDSVKLSRAEDIHWLMNHQHRKIGAEDMLHTVTDMAGIRFLLQDSTKCINRPSFVDSKQRVLSVGPVVFTYDSLVKKESQAKRGQ